ncbi:MAG TPA: acetyl-CoA carboxylase biotin carboxylase subunit [Burkholderiaceae bacterium]|nr:acetyl-CoA carboxylase biotin carboxylase subunit [Burkholderiaceae bacterium]
MTSAKTATPFSKVLVANRGEIALRVMRSAREAGYRTVAVYSTVDARAPHVLAADQAVCIGEPQPSTSYLNVAAIIDAARRSGANAVHPGYGFLAENADFARACRDAALVFIGPKPETIRMMGDKVSAIKVMKAAGVPCVPGYDGDDQSPAALTAEADRIGYPLMIKAVAGGGGRGMRLVASAHEFADALRSAQSEAQHAFGDATAILERAITEPRHIEIQVFADRHGNVIHLGERDCSVQRRHQKLIEESPSPAVGAALRERMGATAVAAARAIGYEGAGTLEFLLDAQGQYHFMEMNTRLQVEHPVTEAITGLDLVVLQLHVAAGEPLPIAQQDVRFSGHAIEVRLCAEDANQGFMPQSGELALWQPPARLRVEHALHSGIEIAPHYDSMLAKVVSHGATRDDARRRLIAGLTDTVALGIKTNQAFLARCLAHPVFAAGGATTAFIERHTETLLRVEQRADRRAGTMAAVLLLETAPGAQSHTAGAALVPTWPMAVRCEIDGRTQTATLTPRGAHRYDVASAGQRHEVEVVELTRSRVRFICDGVMDSASWSRDGDRLWLALSAESFEIVDTTREATARHAGAAGDGQLRASMNGRVVAVAVTVGQRVAAGQPMVTLEAMKMEHVHAAPVAGTVRAVHVSAGDQVAARHVVAEIEPAPAPEGSAAPAKAPTA